MLLVWANLILIDFRFIRLKFCISTHTSILQRTEKRVSKEKQGNAMTTTAIQLERTTKSDDEGENRDNFPFGVIEQDRYKREKMERTFASIPAR